MSSLSLDGSKNKGQAAIKYSDNLINLIRPKPNNNDDKGLFNFNGSYKSLPSLDKRLQNRGQRNKEEDLKFESNKKHSYSKFHQLADGEQHRRNNRYGPIDELQEEDVEEKLYKINKKNNALAQSLKIPKRKSVEPERTDRPRQKRRFSIESQSNEYTPRVIAPYPGYPFGYPTLSPPSPYPYNLHQPYLQLEGFERHRQFNMFFEERDKIKQKLDKNTENLNYLKKEIELLRQKNTRSQFNL